MWAVTSSGGIVGREHELALLRGLLSRPGLVTIVGPGGCGKTCIAGEAARRQTLDAHLPWVIVELGAMDTGTDMLEAVLHALGGHEQPARSILDVVTGCLAGGSQVLVLDNCEQLTGPILREPGDLPGPGPAGSAGPPTSRVALGTPAEVFFRLEPLSLPANADDTSPAWLLGCRPPLRRARLGPSRRPGIRARV